MSLEDVFASVDPVPLATASIAQVRPAPPCCLLPLPVDRLPAASLLAPGLADRPQEACV